ncbi:craniofacial development protein 2-like [Patiria miniata]|uniref:Endonuclease/exonuclease/phosphatase domain-containing protein n=1 Tax=Patiria miniata TaxID=46514 RepID=A0A914AG59_PATMI|nr:craniofacial development protein 2-like [Patiria miniata]
MTGRRETGKSSRTVGPDKRRLPTFKPLVVSTYNVCTLYQQGKTRQLFFGCADAGIDIVGIQEHRLITSNPTEELWSDDKNWVLVYSSATDRRLGGVGLLMSKHIYKCLQCVHVITNRILTATFYENPQLIITIVYAPTECSAVSDKDAFYTSLTDYLDQVKRHNITQVLGDFDARVGLDSHSHHPTVVGRHCFYETTNDNGERLVTMCEENNLHKSPAQMRFPQPKSRF